MLYVNLTGVQQLTDNFALKTLRHLWLLRLQKPFFWGKFQGKALSCTISRGCNLHSVYLKRLGYRSRWQKAARRPDDPGTPCRTVYHLPPHHQPTMTSAIFSLTSVVYITKADYVHTVQTWQRYDLSFLLMIEACRAGRSINRSYHPRQYGSLVC